MRSGWEDGIHVRAQCYVTLAQSGWMPEHVSYIVIADVVELKARLKFSASQAPRVAPKGRRRNAGHFHLPVGELRFLGAEPVEDERTSGSAATCVISCCTGWSGHGSFGALSRRHEDIVILQRSEKCGYWHCGAPWQEEDVLQALEINNFGCETGAELQSND